jgi:hypothetical protein
MQNNTLLELPTSQVPRPRRREFLPLDVLSLIRHLTGDVRGLITFKEEMDAKNQGGTL